MCQSLLLAIFALSALGAPISLDEVYKLLRNQTKDTFHMQMGLMLVTASDGDEFYDLEQTVTVDCQRTVRAITKMYLDFATAKQISDLEEAAISDAFEAVKRSSQLRHPLELFCDALGKAIRRTSLAAEYKKAKQGLNGTAPASRRRYFGAIFSSYSAVVENYTDFFKIPGFVKATMQDEFLKQANASEAYNGTYNALARAIVEVAKKGQYSKKIREIQEKVLSEIGSLIAKSGNIFDNFLDDGKTLTFTLTMMEKYEAYFNEDRELKKELTRAKKIIELER